MPIRENAIELSQHAEKLLDLMDSITPEDESPEPLSEFILSLHPVELSATISSLETEQQSRILKHVTGLDALSAIICLASDTVRQTALEMLDDSRIAAVIRRQEVDDAADIISLLPRRRQLKVLKRLSAEQIKELSSLLAYDQETAGRIMTTSYASFPSEGVAEQTINSLRQQLQDGVVEEGTSLSYLYFLDSNEALKGICSLRQLLAAEPNTPLTEILERDLITVDPDTDQEVVARLIADYDLTALPVCTEKNGKLLGIITVDDVIDVIEDEHAEDLLKLAGTEDQDQVGASILTALKSRLPWLGLSWLGGTFGALVLGNFSTTIEKVVALTFFMPVVFGMGGNVGSQSSTITVYGLATGELGNFRIFSRLRKEASVGVFLGSIFGLLLGLVAFVLYGDSRLSLVVGVSIFSTMVCASALGSMLPIIFNKVGVDPAVASGPLVTTGTDILSITIYFSIAQALL